MTVQLTERGIMTHVQFGAELNPYEIRQIEHRMAGALTAFDQKGTAHCFYHYGVKSFLRGWTPRIAQTLTSDGVRVGWTSESRRMSQPELHPVRGELRRLQPWAIDEMAKHWYGVMELATRFGKSYVYAGWYARMGRPHTLVFVPLEKIARQMREELEGWLGEPVGIIARSTGQRDNWQRFTVACDKSFFDRQGQLYPEHAAYLAQTEAIIRDECHKFGDLGYTIYEHTPNLVWSFGGSATPFVKDPVKDMLLEGYTGPVRAQAKARLLADYGYIAMLLCRWVSFYHQMLPGADWHSLYRSAVINNVQRNGVIKQICDQHRSWGDCGIVFVDRVEHGQELELTIPGSVFVSSTTMNNQAKKDNVLKAFNAREIPVVICTKLWREGVTFRADYAINGEAFKADHVTVQKAGRALMPREDGRYVPWYDFLDFGIPQLENQSQARLHCMRDIEGWDQEFLR